MDINGLKIKWIRVLEIIWVLIILFHLIRIISSIFVIVLYLIDMLAIIFKLRVAIPKILWLSIINSQLSWYITLLRIGIHIDSAKVESLRWIIIVKNNFFVEILNFVYFGASFVLWWVCVLSRSASRAFYFG